MSSGDLSVAPANSRDLEAARREDVELRLYRLEQDARIAEFHRLERLEERAILGAIIQIGICIGALVYAAIEIGWLRADYFVADGPVGAPVLALISLTLFANAVRALQRVFSSRSSKALSVVLEPAE